MLSNFGKHKKTLVSVQKGPVRSHPGHCENSDLNKINLSWNQTRETLVQQLQQCGRSDH